MAWLFFFILIGYFLIRSLLDVGKTFIDAGFFTSIFIILLVYSLWNFGYWISLLILIIFSVTIFTIGNYLDK